MTIRSVAILALLLALGGALGPDCNGPNYRPQNLSATPNAEFPCAAVVSWDPPPDIPPNGILQYRIYRSDSQPVPEYSRIATVAAAATTFSDSTFFDAGFAVFYRVAVVEAVTLTEVGGAWLEFQVPTQPPACPPEVEPRLEARVLLANFPDAPETPYTFADVDYHIFDRDNPDSLVNFWTESSYGLQDIEGFGPNYGVQGYFRLPHPRATYCSGTTPAGVPTSCSFGLLMADLIAHADPSVDFTGVDVLLVFFNGIASSGLAFRNGIVTNEGQIPTAAMKMDVLEGVDRIVVPHEVAHLFAVGHSERVDCPGGGFPPDPLDATNGGTCTLQLGDQFDPMGSLNGSVFSAYSRQQLGFLDPSQVAVVVPGPQPQSIALHQIEVASSGVKMIKIPIGAQSYLFLELHADDPIYSAPVIARVTRPIGAQLVDQLIASAAVSIVLNSRDFPSANASIQLGGLSSDNGVLWRYATITSLDGT